MDEKFSFAITEDKQCFLNGVKLENVMEVKMIDIRAGELPKVQLTLFLTDVNVKYEHGYAQEK